MKSDNIEHYVKLPSGVKASMDDILLTVEGPKGSTCRKFNAPNLSMTVEDGKIALKATRNTKRERQRFGTFKAHVKNMIIGVESGHLRKLKICSGHFPMTVTVSGDEFSVKNFSGEKIPRKLKLPEGVAVKVKGSEVEVSGCDKELVGNVVGLIERLTKRTSFDKRIFQDGIIALMEPSK